MSETLRQVEDDQLWVRSQEQADRVRERRLTISRCSVLDTEPVLIDDRSNSLEMRDRRFSVLGAVENRSVPRR